VVPFVAIGGVIALMLARSLNAIALGDDAARSLGAHVGRTRIGGAVSITLLCGAATAAAGPIYFLGLTVPHAGRALCGPDQRWILVYSAVLGAALLLIADVVGRVLVRPSELQAGVMVAIIGAPVFIALCAGSGSRPSDERPARTDSGPARRPPRPDHPRRATSSHCASAAGRSLWRSYSR
jgi:iron complex transport system permease protein